MASARAPSQLLAPPKDSSGLTFARPPWAMEWIDVLRGFPRPIRVCSPCAGLNAPERAAKELEVPWVSADVCDVNLALKPVLDSFGCESRVGPVAGNVMNVPIGSLQDCDAVISGPPCPPFSTIGHRLTDRDIRTSVFVRIGLWIAELASRDPGQSLSFFILENVEGIRKRAAHESEPFVNWFCREILLLLPDQWEVHVLRANAKNCGVAQSRPRVFIIGTAPCMRRTTFQRAILTRALPVRSSALLIDFLDLEPSPADFEDLTTRQQYNVTSQLEHFHRTCGMRSVGVVDACRDVHRGFDSTVAVNESRTLRTNNHWLWLLPSPDLQPVLGMHGRLMNLREKFRLAGIPPSSVVGLSPQACEVAIGNTIPVPLIGTVMAPLLRAWAMKERSEALNGPEA